MAAFGVLRLGDFVFVASFLDDSFRLLLTVVRWKVVEALLKLTFAVLTTLEVAPHKVLGSYVVLD